MIDMEKLMGQCALELRRRAAYSLLSGNDAQCFTTQQYVDRYIEQTCNDDEFRKVHTELVTEFAETHLRSIGIIEVKPGIWAEQGRS